MVWGALTTRGGRRERRSSPIIAAMRILVLALGTACLLGAQQQAPHEDLSDAEKVAQKYIGDADSIATGHELYLTVCSGCHGVTGEGGRGPNLITGRNIRRSSDEELFAGIKNGVPGSDMPPSPLPDEQIWRLAAFVRNLSAPAYRQQADGDPDAGREVYYGGAGCNQCHMIRGEGGYLGPDLTNAGMTANLTSLREGVFEPNKRLAEGYRPVVVTKSDGVRIRGVAKNNSNYSIQLLDGDGRLHLLQKRDLADVRFQEKSWMPDDYGKRLSEKEAGDLIAFLSRQSVRRTEK